MKIIKSEKYEKKIKISQENKTAQNGRALTFEEWKKIKPNIQPHLAEDGYAFYLEKEVLGRTPTISEMKSIGKINRLLSEPNLDPSKL
jgi:hypothetical protein